MKYSGLLLILFASCISSCKKDPFLPNEARCIERKNISTNFQKVIESSPFNMYPIFNPQKFNQFLYINSFGTSRSLFFFDIESKNVKLILDNVKISNLSLNSKLELVFTDYSGNLFLYNIESKTLDSCPHNGYYSQARWQHDTMIICNYSTNGGHPYQRITLNGSWKVVDSVENLSLFHAASNEDGFIAAITFVDDPNISLYTSKGQFVEKVTKGNPIDGNTRIGGLCWISNNEIAYTVKGKGVMKVNIKTKRVEQLLEGCVQNSYTHIDCSKDGTMLILDRVDKTYPDSATNVQLMRSNIYLYDILTKKIIKPIN